MADHLALMRKQHAKGIGPYTTAVYLLREGHTPHEVRRALDRFHGKEVRQPPPVYAHRFLSLGMLLAAILLAGHFVWLHL
jgi:hypothetical protein